MQGITLKVVRAVLYSLISVLVVSCMTQKSDMTSIDKLLPVPAFWSPLMSPDGKKVSYVTIHNGAPNLFIAPVDSFKKGQPITSITGQGVTTSNVAGYTTYRWTPDSQYLLYLRDQSGDERWHLMVTDVRTGESRDLTPYENIQARLVAISKDLPSYALVEINDRNPDYHDLYRININTGERQLVLKNDRYIGFFADNQLEPRVAIAGSDDGGFDIYRYQKEEWQLFIHLAQEDTSALIRSVEQNAWNFSADNKKLRFYDSRQRDTWAIVEIDIESGKTVVLAQDEAVDIDSAFYSQGMNLELWRANLDRAKWHAASADIQLHLDRLYQPEKGDLAIISRSQAGNIWLISYSASHRSPDFYIYDQTTKTQSFLATQMPDINALDLPESKPFITKSRDGLTLVSYVLLPKEIALNDNGTPEKPLPMVVLVHGGPNDERAVYSYHPYMQWLANRGYAVMNVNYRGSPGFGKHFLNAQNLEWGKKMNLDVIDQVQWAIEKGIADKDKVGIFGGSYGGYEVLVALTKTPDVFACGIDLAGPSEMESFIKIWWENFIPATNMAYKSIILGDPETEEGQAALKESSPLYFAHQLKKPLLIIQGDQDSRVPTPQAALMADALVEHGKPVTYVLFQEEGHGVVRPENQKAYHAMIEVFFSQCLGGDHEPITDQFDKAGFTVPVNDGRMPGLQ